MPREPRDSWEFGERELREIRENKLKILVRKMKIDCSNQTRAEVTDRQTEGQRSSLLELLTEPKNRRDYCTWTSCVELVSPPKAWQSSVCLEDAGCGSWETPESSCSWWRSPRLRMTWGQHWRRREGSWSIPHSRRWRQESRGQPQSQGHNWKDEIRKEILINLTFGITASLETIF